MEGKDVKRFTLGWAGQWLEYGRNLAAPRDAELFEGSRVLIRQIPSKPPFCINAAVVTGDELNDINSIIVKTPSEDDAFFVAAILNSRVISQWFIEKFDKFQRKTFPQVKTNELASFPIPSETPKAIKSEIIGIGRKLAKAYESNQADSKIKSLEDDLDEAVTELLFVVKKAARKKAA